MKKLYLLILVFACLFPLCSSGQSPAPRAIASPAQLQERMQYRPPLVDESTFTNQAGHVAPLSRPTVVGGHLGRVTAINAIPLGTATNVFSILRPEQNQIVAIDSLDLVAFIHRSDVNIFGGSSGNLRYDVSIDRGTTFNNDLGPMNPSLARPARYPNITGMNFPGGSNPLNSHLVYGGPTVDNGVSIFDGVVAGMTSVVTSGSVVTTEHYLGQGQGTHLTGGLCQSAPGLYWMVEFEGNGSIPTGNLRIYKGEYNPGIQDVDWIVFDTLLIPHYTGFNGSPNMVGCNIAFSPDGETGWIGFLGDLVGGPDSTLLPCFFKSTDCGATWGSAMEVNLNNIPWIKDSLQTLWTDSLGSPASNGRAACAFDYDMTVDANGNPHLGAVVCTGIDYSVSSGLAKFLGDVTSNSGGATWEVNYISPVLTFRTSLFGTSPQVSMDNFVQVARDEGGCNIFFSWADSDTSQITGNGNGIGFGESANLAPNLRIAALNVGTGQQTYPQLVTDGDLIWEGAMLFPTMAPIVLSDANGWNLPIVSGVMTGQDPINVASFFYFGNNAVIPNSNWCAPASMSLSWDFFGNSNFVSPCAATPVSFCNAAVNGTCVPVGVEAAGMDGISLGDAFPNPTNGMTRIAFSLPTTASVSLTMHNSIGQVVRVLAGGEFGSGLHTIDVETSSLATGLYMFTLSDGERTMSKKLVVTR